VIKRAASPLVAHVMAVFAIAIPPAGNAASSPEGSEAQQSTSQLQEIIVTAQKRAGDIKDIPFSVSAIGAAELAEHHVADYDDIARTVPGLGFTAGPGPGLDNIEIRGVSSLSGSATVGIYIDEVPVTVNNSQYDGAVQPKLFDLDRVEVLRGPQGTLFGASSMGGTIRFITKQPDLDNFSATVSTDLSDTHHGGFNNDEYGILNVPVIDGVFALRLGVDLANESGYIDHYVPTANGAAPGNSVLLPGITDNTGVLGERGVNDVRTQVVRLTGKIAAPDEWTITPALLWQRTAASDTNVFYPDLGLYDQDKRVKEPYADDVTVPSLTINKSFGWADFIAISSYFKRDFRRQTDGTLYNSNILANSFIAGGFENGFYTTPPTPAATQQQLYATETQLGFLSSPAGYDARTAQFSEEMRLSSKTSHIGGIPVTWTAGVYYADQRRRFLDDEYIPGLQATFERIFGYPIGSNASILGPTYYPAGAGFPAESFANDLIYFGHMSPDQKQIAPFGEATVDITASLKGTIGLRYVSAKSTETVNSGGFYSYGLPAAYVDDSKYHATTPRFSLEYALNESTNLYTTIGKGFRLGGPTGPVPAFQPNGPPPATAGPCDADYGNYHLTAAPKGYDSDWLWSYEVGSKGRYFDNRLSIDTAIYAIDWSHIQQTINLPTCGFYFTANIGDAKVYGSELEIRTLVASGLTLSLNAGSSHAYLSSVSALGSGIAYPVEAVLGVPVYTVTPSVDYDIPISDRTTLFVRADFPYTGRSRGYFDSSGLPHVFQPGYGVGNLNMGIMRDKLTVGLYAKNLANLSNVIQYPSVNSVQQGYTVRPLTFGITATFQL